jgi:hypothetical protein
VAAGFVARTNFVPVPPSSRTQEVWDTLLKQEALSTMSIDNNLLFGNLAWESSGPPSGAFRHETQRTKLCDNALRCWMGAYLLGEPVLRHSDSAFG